MRIFAFRHVWPNFLCGTLLTYITLLDSSSSSSLSPDIPAILCAFGYSAFYYTNNRNTSLQIVHYSATVLGLGYVIPIDRVGITTDQRVDYYSLIISTTIVPGNTF